MAASILVSEKRRLPRRELLYYLRVNDHKGQQQLGRLVDIHSRGLLLIGDNCLNVGQEYLIEIELPKALSEQGIPQIVAKSRCIWAHPSLARPFNESGLMILETSEEGQKNINLLIDMFALPDITLKA
jgi:hypothetical protein